MRGEKRAIFKKKTKKKHEVHQISWKVEMRGRTLRDGGTFCREPKCPSYIAKLDHVLGSRVSDQKNNKEFAPWSLVLTPKIRSRVEVRDFWSVLG